MPGPAVMVSAYLGWPMAPLPWAWVLVSVMGITVIPWMTLTTIPTDMVSMPNMVHGPIADMPVAAAS